MNPYKLGQIIGYLRSIEAPDWVTEIVNEIQEETETAETTRKKRVFRNPRAYKSSENEGGGRRIIH